MKTSDVYTKIPLTDLDSSRDQHRIEKINALNFDNLRTMTQEANMENRQMSLSYSSTF